MFKGKYGNWHRISLFALIGCSCLLLAIALEVSREEIYSLYLLFRNFLIFLLSYNLVFSFIIRGVALQNWCREKSKIIEILERSFTTDTGRRYFSLYLKIEDEYKIGDEVEFCIHPNDNSWYYLDKT